MITSVTALSLFCPVWQQHSICLCLNRDNINMENIPRTSEIKYQISITFNDIEELLAITFTSRYSWCFSLKATELVKVTSAEIDEARFVIPQLLSH